MTTKRARSLNDDDILGDGAVILTLSFQRDYVYAKVWNVNTKKMTTRRYRNDQQVRVGDES